MLVSQDVPHWQLLLRLAMRIRTHSSPDPHSARQSDVILRSVINSNLGFMDPFNLDVNHSKQPTSTSPHSFTRTAPQPPNLDVPVYLDPTLPPSSRNIFFSHHGIGPSETVAREREREREDSGAHATRCGFIQEDPSE